MPMHGAKDTLLAFVRLGNARVAFEQHAGNPETPQFGVTHPGNAGGNSTAGTMHHLALSIDSLDGLYAMRDRLRENGVNVLGPINHGMCHSIYFAGLEGLALEIACGGQIDPKLWVDPAAQAAAGITDAEIGQFVHPKPYVKPREPVKQPGVDAGGPHLVYPSRKVYEKVIAVADDKMLNSVESEPPNKVPRANL